jgi:hypothetical protein
MNLVYQADTRSKLDIPRRRPVAFDPAAGKAPEIGDETGAFPLDLLAGGLGRLDEDQRRLRIKYVLPSKSSFSGSYSPINVTRSANLDLGCVNNRQD